MDGKLKQIAEEQEITLQPGFWDDPKKAEQTMRAISEKKEWTDAYAAAQAAHDDLAHGGHRLGDMEAKSGAIHDDPGGRGRRRRRGNVAHQDPSLRCFRIR